MNAARAQKVIYLRYLLHMNHYNGLKYGNNILYIGYHESLFSTKTTMDASSGQNIPLKDITNNHIENDDNLVDDNDYEYYDDDEYEYYDDEYSDDDDEEFENDQKKEWKFDDQGVAFDVKTKEPMISRNDDLKLPPGVLFFLRSFGIAAACIITYYAKWYNGTLSLFGHKYEGVDTEAISDIVRGREPVADFENLHKMTGDDPYGEDQEKEKDVPLESLIQKI